MMGAEPRQDAFMGAEEDNYLISLRGALQVFRRRLWVIMLVTLVLTGAAVGYSLQQTPQYAASIKILIGQERNIVDETPQDAYALQGIAATMVEAINTRPVAEAVIQRLGLRTSPETLLANMSVEQFEDTQFIQVTYSDSDPERARQVANTIGSVFSEKISEVSPKANAVTATVWEPAVTPVAPVSPNPLRAGFTAAVLGILLGMGLAYLLEFMDDSWQSPEEAEQVSGVPTFGVVPAFGVVKGMKKGGN